MIRIAIADDHALVLHGIKQILSFDKNIRVVSEARSGWEVLQKLSDSPVDLIMLDIKMPGPPAVDLIKRLRRDYSSVPILMLSMFSETQIVSRILRAGATGYITKDNDPEVLFKAIHRVSQGKRYIDPGVAEKMAFGSVSTQGDEPHKQLSEREFQVLELLQSGKINKDIATTLNLSIKTVSTYKTRIMKKLGVTSDIDLLRYAIKHQLLSLD